MRPLARFSLLAMAAALAALPAAAKGPALEERLRESVDSPRR